MSLQHDAARATDRVESGTIATCADVQQPATTISPSSMSFQTARPVGRLARLRSQLGQRERSILETLEQFRLLTGAQVQRLLVHDGSSVTQARRTRATMKRLTDLKLVVRLGRRVGGIRAGSSGYVYGLSGLGQGVMSAEAMSSKSRRRVWETSPSHTDHLLAVADLYIAASEAARGGQLELLEFQAEPPCWRRFAGVGGQTITLKPDAFVRLGIGDIELNTFVEVDLGTESTPTLVRKCLTYVQYWRSGIEQHRHEVFPRVLWLTPTARRVEQIEQTLRRVPFEARPLFQVALLDDWQTAVTVGGGDVA